MMKLTLRDHHMPLRDTVSPPASVEQDVASLEPQKVSGSSVELDNIAPENSCCTTGRAPTLTSLQSLIENEDSGAFA